MDRDNKICLPDKSGNFLAFRAKIPRIILLKLTEQRHRKKERQVDLNLEAPDTGRKSEKLRKLGGDLREIFLV